MTTFDLSPLFRSTVGFDRLSRLLESAARVEDGGPSYPPYNIEKTGEHAYRIVMAVAGFAESDINIVVENGVLLVRGKLDKASDDVRYLHRGIAERAFERRFQLADYIEVAGATLENGLLKIDLVHEVPEALKPRKIEIQSAPDRKSIDSKKAA